MKNLLPVQQFMDSVVLEDEGAARSFNALLGPPVSAKGVKSDTLAAIARRRCWYFIRTGRENSACPAHQRVVTKLYCNIVDDARLDAAATTSGKYNIIGINAGTVSNVFGFFYLLLSHPRILPEYGFSKTETMWSASLRACDWRQPMSSILRQSTGDHTLRDTWRAPSDWFRQSIADTLATMALDFVFFHEIAHLRRGHLHFLKAEANASKVDETWSSGTQSVQKAKQAFELDADGGAMEVTLTPWLHGKFVKGFETREARPEEALVLWSIAIAFLFLLFDPLPRSLEQYADADHPHPAVRLTHVFLQAKHIAESVSNAAAVKFEEAWWEGLRQVAVASSTLDLQSSVFHVLHSTEMRNVVAEQQRIVAHLMKLVDSHPSLRL